MERPYEGNNGNNPITVKCVIPPGGVEVGLFSAGDPFPDFDPMRSSWWGTSRPIECISRPFT
jgi:hypothetical protein